MTPLKRLIAASAAVGIALTATLVGTGPMSPALATEARSPVTVVEKLTGPDAPNNTWGRWDIKSTDLGIMWERPGTHCIRRHLRQRLGRSGRRVGTERQLAQQCPGTLE